jgi:hypothetical protein
MHSIGLQWTLPPPQTFLLGSLRLQQSAVSNALHDFANLKTFKISCACYSDINYVTLGPVQGALDADWEVLNQNQWRVRFLSIKFSIAGIQLVNKPIADTVGLWTITYLDDELRILTARSLARNDGGNVYVLKRE